MEPSLNAALFLYMLMRRGAIPTHPVYLPQLTERVRRAGGRGKRVSGCICARPSSSD